MHIAWLGAYILIAEHWLEKEEIVFTNGDYDCKPWGPAPTGNLLIVDGLNAAFRWKHQIY